MFVILAVLVLIVSIQPSLAQGSIGVVETEYGLMAGVPGQIAGVTLFKGVPYAKPPVGELRWAPPQEPESWEGVRLMDTYPNACLQYTFDGDMNAEPWKSDFYYVELPELSEDCLYINIATSAVTGDEAMPVFVWFHGGGLRHGYSHEVEFNPNVLASKGVIVVTVGQRLGVFGYMALPQLSAESGYGGSGNYGLMDEIKALEWIQANIAGFGGDPSNVTVGGQSGGTTKSGALFVADQAEGLAHRAIWQSGLQFTNSYASLEEAEGKGVAWLQHLGLIGDESLEDLRATDARFFLGRSYADYQPLAPSSMNVDGEYIKVSRVLEAFVDGGRLDGIDILVGSNLGEANYDRNITNAEQFYASFRELLGDLYDTYDFENLVHVTNQNATDVARALASYGLGTHSSRNVTLGQVAGAEVFENSDVYVYLFTRFLPGRDEHIHWAWHSGEMWYTFASMRDIPEQRAWTEWDHQLADMMSTYWANFIKTSDPNGEGLPTWAPTQSGAQAYMEFGDEVVLDTEISKLDALMIEFVKRQFAIE
jgi:para-nitrobenzyl esterase